MGVIPPHLPKQRLKYKNLRFVSKLCLLVFAFIFALFSGQSIKYYATLGCRALSQGINTHGHVFHGYHVSGDKPIFISAPPWPGHPVGAKALNRTDWNFNCSSSRHSAHGCKLAFDEKERTYWQSADGASNHSVEIDLQSEVNVHGLAVKPHLFLQPIGASARRHRVDVATKNSSWDLVAYGTWRNISDGEQLFSFMSACTSKE